MPLGTDFVLGPFNVAPTGRLSLRDPERQQGFCVHWRGCSVHALILEGGVGLRAVPGRVPSTAGAARALREPLFTVLRNLPAQLPRAWKLSLLPDHRIEVAGEEKLDLPASAIDLIAVITQFLLALAPYLDLMEEIGIGGGPPAAIGAGPGELGTAKA